MYTQTAFPVIDLAGTGRSIERHRRDAGLTVRDLQAYFGFEYPQAIYKWQHGECLPTVDNLLALAKLLQVSMEDLLVYEDQEVSPVLGIIKAPASLQGLVQCFHFPLLSMPSSIRSLSRALPLAWRNLSVRSWMVSFARSSPVTS